MSVNTTQLFIKVFMDKKITKNTRYIVLLSQVILLCNKSQKQFTMKTATIIERILTLVFLLFSFLITAQEYCDYDNPTPIDFGMGAENVNDSPYELLELSDGKFLAIGDAVFGNFDYRVALARLNVDNTLDTTFGTNGRLTLHWEARNNCISAILQEDGKILIGGYQAPGNGFSTFRCYIARLMDDGSPDTTFGINGNVKINARGTVVEINQKQDGKIQALVTTISTPGDILTSGYEIHQFDEFGNYDNTFGTNGRIHHEIPNVLYLVKNGDGLFMEDGSAIIVGKVKPDIVKPCIVKLTPDGDLDTNFADGGILYIEAPVRDGELAISAQLTADEDIIIATTGDFPIPFKYLLFKVDGESGELDVNFGNNGMLESTSESDFHEVFDVVIDPSNENILVVGQAFNGVNGRASAIWHVSAGGEEIENCDGSTLQIFPFVSDNKYRAAVFSSAGALHILGQIWAIPDEQSPSATQNQNYMIPGILNTTGIDDNPELTFNIFPNPVENRISISTENNEPIDVINIYNQLGQQVLQENNVVNAIDVSNLTKGIYIIELVSGNSIFRRKMIKS